MTGRDFELALGLSRLPVEKQAASVQMPCRARLTTVLRASGRSLFRRMPADLSSAFQR
jgi:hypothetical protein